jgi:ubiquinone/menaquinone biosynthesis C-methylase UbiE
MEMNNDRLEREFERLGPWLTGFIINGKRYGGEFCYAGDERIQMFFEAFPDARKILDLGILEGGQTFEIAKKPGVSVIGIEGREENLGRASFVREVLGLDNVRLVLGDLEKEELDWLGQFDAVFCCGTLYHLPRPWELIAKLSRVTSNLFVWTEYALEKDATKIVGNEYRGLWYREGKDPGSGLSPKSFWPSLGSLCSMIWQNGFTRLTIVELNPYHDIGSCVSIVATK